RGGEQLAVAPGVGAAVALPDERRRVRLPARPREPLRLDALRRGRRRGVVPFDLQLVALGLGPVDELREAQVDVAGDRREQRLEVLGDALDRRLVEDVGAELDRAADLLLVL